MPRRARVRLPGSHRPTHRPTHRPAHRPARATGPSAGPSVLLPWMLPTEATEDLATVAVAEFDAHYLRRLAEHHHATIERSRSEMVEGLSSRGRRLAEEAISRNCAGLHRLRKLSPA